jgi:hypothetical protein
MMKIKTVAFTWAVFGLFLFNFACGDDKPSPGGAPTPAFGGDGPALDPSWTFRNSAINHEQGKSSHGFFLFGDFKGSQAAQDAVARGLATTITAMKKEYPQGTFVPTNKYGIVFWKPSTLCKFTPAFIVSYVVTAAGDPYDKWGDYNVDDEYDKDPRKARVAICATGKSKIHTWTNGTKYDGSDTLYRMDIVEDAGEVGEATARHEGLHLALLQVDLPKFNETVYHGGDWERLLSLTEPTRVGLKSSERSAVKGQVAKVIVDGEEFEFEITK